MDNTLKVCAECGVGVTLCVCLKAPTLFSAPLCQSFTNRRLTEILHGDRPMPPLRPDSVCLFVFPLTTSHRRLVPEHFGPRRPHAAVHAALSAVRLQRLKQLVLAERHRLPLDGVLDGLRREVVDDGVEAAVGDGDAQGDGVDGPHH